MADESTRDMDPYSALAVGYDLVMQHVEYEVWAAYLHRLLEQHGSNIDVVLELGCGTGSLALQLQPLGNYDYIGTDRSPQMIRVAQIKAEEAGLDLRFEQLDFTTFDVSRPVDAIILVYDGLNYLLEREAMRSMMVSVMHALRPGGIFCFDQSTPNNSIRHGRDFEDAGEADGFAFVRHSRYDATTRLHTTTFDITIDGRRYHEKHIQRAYTMAEVEQVTSEVGFQHVAAYDNFSFEAATSNSERIHWVVRRPSLAE
jgi:ubiquinone/menaquinone biosynthesis C-methylase UbiE